MWYKYLFTNTNVTLMSINDIKEGNSVLMKCKFYLLNCSVINIMHKGLHVINLYFVFFLNKLKFIHFYTALFNKFFSGLPKYMYTHVDPLRLFYRLYILLQLLILIRAYCFCCDVT